MSDKPGVAIIGAGPAGLTAAYLLTKQGMPVTVLESHPTLPGGIARTETWKGYRFDIGGHRFFSKSQRVEDLWTELLPNDLLVRPRSSRIFYGGRFFAYPLRGFEALWKLGPFEAARCLVDYAAARIHPRREVKSLEDWTVNQFGRRLYEIFFKTYTEKVWGIPCHEISADWAAQRIKGLSLGTAIWNALKPQRPASRDKVVKSLIDSFRYPRHGPGMLWEACTAKVRAQGGEVRFGRTVTGCSLGADGLWTVAAKAADGKSEQVRAAHVISTTTIRALMDGLSPAPAAPALAAARSLKYRDYFTVLLILEDRHLFEDNWIYIHDPGVKVGRVQHYKSWSPEMVPDPKMACYGMEYFCFEGDSDWTAADADLVRMATAELEKIGLARAGEVQDGTVVRQRAAYPVYDEGYADRVALVRDEIRARYPGLHLVGRNGMHKYNNQDHSMMTAMLCVENILAGRELHDVWLVNQDAEYHEESSGASGERAVPKRVAG